MLLEQAFDFVQGTADHFISRNQPFCLFKVVTEVVLNNERDLFFFIAFNKLRHEIDRFYDLEILEKYSKVRIN